MKDLEWKDALTEHYRVKELRLDSILNSRKFLPRRFLLAIATTQNGRGQRIRAQSSKRLALDEAQHSRY